MTLEEANSWYRNGRGKFSNGAISGAFSHMFNAEGGKLIRTNNLKQSMRQGRANRMQERSVRGHNSLRKSNILSSDEAYSRVLNIEANNATAVKILGSLAVGGIGGMAVRAGYGFVMANPLKTMGGVGVLDNLFLGGTSPTNVFEGIASQIHDFNPWAVK